jgi:hypothetical protein
VPASKPASHQALPSAVVQTALETSSFVVLRAHQTLSRSAQLFEPRLPHRAPDTDERLGCLRHSCGGTSIHGQPEPPVLDGIEHRLSG